MEKLLSSYAQQSGANVASDPNQNSWLFTFPREIVRKISSFLPPESVVCLTLTCKLALHILGTSSWKDEMINRPWIKTFNKRSRPRLMLMELLNRDMEELGFVVCKSCITLHKPLKRPSEFRKMKLTRFCWTHHSVVEFLPLNEDGFGYNLVGEHIRYVMRSTPIDSDSPIEYLSGLHQVPHPYLDYTVASSARRINGDLVLRHDHRFSLSSAERPLKAADILGIPFRICTHLTTSTDQPVMNRETRYATPNGPLLTYSVVSAFPADQRAEMPGSDVFREPTVEEELQMTSADRDRDFVFRCHGCLTKWRVRYADGKGNGCGELTISAFHCFSKDMWEASRYFRWLVRRNGYSVGKGLKNDEFFSMGRNYPDFEVE
ncbi:hypothetical protein F4805DRAFT_431919 [Annulohypoxylon moriforme]|nr:hypothetical protein F4805DRAFT_431919 [Annulohypoxylon moriforme]